MRTKFLRFILILLALNAMFFYGMAEVDMTNYQFAFGVLVVNLLLAPISFMLTMLYPKNQ